MKLQKKNLILILILLFLAFSLNGCGVLKKIVNIFRFGEENNFEYGVTALQWLPAIEERAKSWTPDAYFYGISEAPVNRDGASDKWSYLYYSPGSEKVCMVVYEAGFISIKEVILPPLNSIRSLKLDSPAALNIANQNGGDYFIKNNQNVSIIMSLYGPRTGSAAPKWYIKYYGDVQSLTFVVDAITGKLEK